MIIAPAVDLEVVTTRAVVAQIQLHHATGLRQQQRRMDDEVDDDRGARAECRRRTDLRHFEEDGAGDQWDAVYAVLA